MSEDDGNMDDQWRSVSAVGFGLGAAVVSFISLVNGGAGLPPGSFLTIAVIAFFHSWAGFILAPLLFRYPGHLGLTLAGIFGGLTPLLALALNVLILVLFILVGGLVGSGWMLAFLAGEANNPALSLEPMGDVVAKWWALVLVSAVFGFTLHVFSRVGSLSMSNEG
jgi:hypothetical protein